MFQVYGSALKALSPERETLGAVAAAGCFAGAVQSLLSAPVEHIKIRSQMQRARPGSVGFVPASGMVAKVVKAGGIPALFTGLSATFLRDIPSYGVYFVLYDWTGQAMAESLGDGLGPLEHLVAGGVAGSGAWASIYPVDVVKTRIQSSSLDGRATFLG